MSLTANELFRQYMAMSYEDRQQFLTMFKQLYDAQKLGTTFMPKKKEKK